MTRHYLDKRTALYHGDCIDVIARFPEQYVNAIVTDPPYELGFMGRAWDASGIAYRVDFWEECLRVLKPGGHLLAFGGTRTHHRLACAIEDAGFEIRDSITWIYGSGFPKSLNVSKAIDKAAGAEPSEGAREWSGWGTALKPSHEPIVVARKPLAGTVASNVTTHGTGALNIDATRIGSGGQLRWAAPRDMGYHGGTDAGPVEATANDLGRWPSNVVLDQEMADELDRQSGTSASPTGTVTQGGRRLHAGNYGSGSHHDAGDYRGEGIGYGDSGGASRFFPVFRYQAKAPTRERPKVNGIAHPTVKPLELMRWLVRLVTAPGGIVLDPFAGSGTTAEACALEGMRCIAIEREADYLPLILSRLERAGVAA